MKKATWNSGFHTEEVKYIRTHKPTCGCQDIAIIKRENGEREEYVLKSEIQLLS